MSSSADSTMFSKALFNPELQKIATEKKVLRVQDSNNSSYNGVINFDTSAISNSSMWVDYSNAVLTVPLCVSIQSSADISGQAHSYMAGLKSGYHQLIHSINVDLNNKNIVSQQSFSNFYISYKLLTEWSENDIQKYGDLCGFYPDDANYTRSAAAAAKGDGCSNNTPYTVAATRGFTGASPIDVVNTGLQRRLNLTAQNAGSALGGLNTTVTAAQLNAVGKNYFTNDGAAGAARVYTYYILATIRLRDVHDWFAQSSLLKGCQLRIQVVYNAARCVVAGVSGVATMALTSTTLLSGATVPFMLCDSSASNAGNALVSTTGTITVEANIGRTVSPACALNPLQSGCQLYVPAYALTPEAESQYLASSPIKTIFYDPIYQFTVPGITAGASFSTILSNGILNCQKLVVMPYISSSSTGNSQKQEASPFDSAPATTAPLASLSQFQVSISGRNCFDRNVSYTFEMFKEEVSKSGVYGGDVVGQSSGLISKKMWDYTNSYYVCDLSRRLESADSIPLAVAIQGQNNTSATLDLVCFVTYQRSVQIDLQTGIPL